MIVIDTNRPGFKQDPGLEIATVLRKLADMVQANYTLDHTYQLRDSQDNKCGGAWSVPSKPIHEQTEPELQAQMDISARALAATLPPNTGFIALAFEKSRPGAMQYIANCERESCLQAMREFLYRATEPGGDPSHIERVKFPMGTGGSPFPNNPRRRFKQR